jgi:hypothetical protein
MPSAHTEPPPEFPLSSVSAAVPLIAIVPGPRSGETLTLDSTVLTKWSLLP